MGKRNSLPPGDLADDRCVRAADLNGQELITLYITYSAEVAYRLDIADDWYDEFPSLRVRSLQDRTDDHLNRTQQTLEMELHRRFQKHPAHVEFMRWVQQPHGPNDPSSAQFVRRLIAMLRALMPKVLAQ